jgi:YVTN family beta-propeller protein
MANRAFSLTCAAIAQSGERLICNQQVGSSILPGGSVLRPGRLVPLGTGTEVGAICDGEDGPGPAPAAVIPRNSYECRPVEPIRDDRAMSRFHGFTTAAVLLVLILLTSGSFAVLASASPTLANTEFARERGGAETSEGSTIAHSTAANSGSNLLAPSIRASSTLPALGASYGRVAETLDLLNDSLIHGNFTDVANGIAPYAVVADSANGNVYVADSSSLGVSVVDGSNGTLIGSIPTVNTPTALAVDPNHGVLFVVTRPVEFLGTMGNVTMVATSTDRVIATVPVHGIPSAATYDPANGYLYVTLVSKDVVAVVNTATDVLVGTLPVGTSPDAAAYNAGNGFVYIANNGSANITAIDGANDSIASSIPVGTDPVALQPLDGTDDLYVAEFGSDALGIVNLTTNELVDSVSLGFGPQGLAEDSSLGLVYTDNSSLNVFDAINFRTQSVITTVPVGRGPAGLVVDPGNGDLYLAESLSDNLTVANAASRGIVGSIQLGLEPEAAAFDTASDELGVVMSDQNALWLFNATTDVRLQTIPVGVAPADIVYDSINECFYVSNSGSSTVSVVNGTTNHLVATVSVETQPGAMAFAPSYGYVFVADGNGQGSPDVTEIRGADNTVVAHLPMGGTVAGVAYDATNGDLYVGTGSGITVLDPISKATVTTIPTAYLQPTLGIDGATGEVLAGGVFDTSFGISANLSIIDPATNQILANVTVGDATDGIDYDVETGLAYVASAFNDTVSVVNISESTTVGTLSVGSSPAGISDDGSAGQLFVTNSDSGTLSIVTIPGAGRYPVNFTERGLPTGQSWAVTIAGHVVSSTSSSLVAVERDGTLGYTVTPVVGFTASPNASSVTVDDSFAAVSISFVALPPTFAVEFVESGLPTGANWSVHWQGQANVTTHASSITVESVNGSFSWTASSDAGYSASPDHGSTTVSGLPLTVDIAFTASQPGSTTSNNAGVSAFAAYEGFGVAGIAAVVGALAGALVPRNRDRVSPPSSSSPEPPGEPSTEPSAEPPAEPPAS